EQGVGIDARGAAILHFVDECVQQVKVSADTFNAVRRYYDEVQLAELALMIGHYMMTARFLETLEIDLDLQATSWENMSTD
ncbi:MAG: carboxymuconolactone decarboxylase family protein, partial [Serratia marcescens]|nr:carboxymuconolactone decarboxylase family protein [Serratia marcescens]